MEATNVINVFDFMQYLKDNNLVIANVNDIEMGKEVARQRLLKRKALKLTEIITAGFFPIKDSETLRRMCLDGRIPKDAWYTVGKKNMIMVLTSQIKKMSYE